MTTALIGKLAWVIMVVAWYVVRYPFERRARRARVERSDRGLAETVRMSISFAGLGLLPGVAVATGWPRFARTDPTMARIVVGIAIGVFALVLFRKTHKALGRMWSVSLDIRKKHRLVTSGIYGRLRHPMYSAFWIMALAQALLIPNAVAGPAGLVGFAILFFARIGPEERLMEAAFGEEYLAYKRRTARIIPGIF